MSVKVNYKSGVEKNIPKELLEGRSIVEGNMVACLWKDPSLYDNFDLEIADFLTTDGELYYILGKNMREMGYKQFDIITVTTHLKDKPIIQEKINFNAINSIRDLVDLDNIDAYYDELVKYNILVRLNLRGFDVVKNLDRFKNTTSEGVYAWFEKELNKIFIKKQLGVEPVELTEDFDDFLAECDRGSNLGIQFGTAMPILNQIFAGLHKKNVLLHTAHSGVGKTSSCLTMYILPLLAQGKNVCVMANEQGEKEWRSLLLPTIVSNILGYKNFNRNRMQYGGFTDEEWMMLREAQEWLLNCGGSLKFVDLPDYSIPTIKKVIGKHANEGYDVFIYDTAKPEDETSERAWAVFTENSKELFQIAKKHDIVMIATAQLSISTLSQRFVNATCLAKSKAIKEVAGQVVMIRNLWKDEYTGENKDVEVYRRKMNSQGELTKTREFITLDKDKEYAVLFIDKNRFGKDGIQLLLEKDLGTNVWKEVGICSVRPF